MNTLSRVVGEAAMGLGISIGLNDQHISPENQPAHIALVHGDQSTETSAPAALVPLCANREERRIMSRVIGVAYAPAESEMLHDFLIRKDAARVVIENRRKLARLGRSA